MIIAMHSATSAYTNFMPFNYTSYMLGVCANFMSISYASFELCKRDNFALYEYTIFVSLDFANLV
jgi:hypothetical protein